MPSQQQASLRTCQAAAMPGHSDTDRFSWTHHEACAIARCAKKTGTPQQRTTIVSNIGTRGWSSSLQPPTAPQERTRAPLSALRSRDMMPQARQRCNEPIRCEIVERIVKAPTHADRTH